MTAINAALSFALASYAQSAKGDAPITRVVETKLVKSTKNKKPVVKAEPVVQATPKESAPIGSFKLPEKGSLEARGYIKMMRSAPDRNEKILAIAAFIGYDMAQDYGSQELAANMAAKRELSPIDTTGPSLVEERAAKRSAMGYVSGMPNGLQVKLQNLLGREKLAVEVMLDNQKQCDEFTKSGDSALATHHAGLALLEQERLDAIQAEIRSIVG